jgi:uncharacterized Zn finger protein (UPF0148 family)
MGTTMTRCQHCHATSQLYLCDNCQTLLANMLNQLPWLIDELDNRIQQLDRITLGTIRRQRRPAELNVIDFDAAETAHKVRKTLLHWVTTIAERHTGRPPAALSTTSTKNLARWLEANTDAIARLSLTHKGRHRLYDDIAHLVGTPDHKGQLLNAINPHEQHFAGTCPTIRGHHGNEPIECGTMLYADVDETTVTCPTCRKPIDVEHNRMATAKARDLRTRNDILEVLADIDETITEQQLDRWITAKRLRIRGYFHNGTITDTRTNKLSQPLYSVAKARKLRRRDEQLQRLRHALAELR